METGDLEHVSGIKGLNKWKAYVNKKKIFSGQGRECEEKKAGYYFGYLLIHMCICMEQIFIGKWDRRKQSQHCSIR